MLMAATCQALPLKSAGIFMCNVNNVDVVLCMPLIFIASCIVNPLLAMFVLSEFKNAASESERAKP